MSDDNPLKNRFDPPEREDQSSSEDEPSDDGETHTSESSEGPDQSDNIENTDKTDKADNTDNTKHTGNVGQTDEKVNSAEDEGVNASTDKSKGDTRRDRPHTAMYISKDLVDQMKSRYRKINGELMIEEGEEIELNKHFYEGLIKAGLENPELEEIVLNQRDQE
mgnify:CR=1 FL=1